MSQSQTQGLGGLTYKSTNDLSGTVVDVTNGNPIGSTYKNAVGLAAIADTGNACSIVVAGANALVLGVILDTPKAGQPAQIQSARGTSAKVLSGGVFAIGDKLVTDSNGRAVLAGSTAKLVYAVAQEASTAAGLLIEAVLVDSYVA